MPTTRRKTQRKDKVQQDNEIINEEPVVKWEPIWAPDFNVIGLIILFNLLAADMFAYGWLIWKIGFSNITAKATPFVHRFILMNNIFISSVIAVVAIFGYVELTVRVMTNRNYHDVWKLLFMLFLTVGAVYACLKWFVV
jgi:hypothetical protein